MISSTNNFKEILDQNNINLSNVSFSQLNDRLIGLEASADYFATSIAMQTGIFAVIVTVVVGLIGLASYFKYKSKIKEEVRKQLNFRINYAVDKMKKEINCEFKKETTKLKEEIDQMRDNYADTFSILNADVARSIALGADNMSNFSSGFNWWMNTAQLMHKADKLELVRISLERAIADMNKVDTLKNINLEDYNKFSITLNKENYIQEFNILDRKIKKLMENI